MPPTTWPWLPYPVSFDVSGSGTNDLITAKGTGPAYTASLPALSGPKGTRTLTASAIDTSGNTATTSISVNVESPNPIAGAGFARAAQRHTRRTGFHSNGEGFELCVGLHGGVERQGRSHFVGERRPVTATISKADIATAGSATGSGEESGSGRGNVEHADVYD